MAKDIIIVVVHTRRKENIRIISARKASTLERKKYYEYIQRKTKTN